MKRILVLRGGALGDFLVTLPALQALRNRWPDARIELVGNAGAAALGVEAGLFNTAESQHQGAWYTLYGPTPDPALLRRLEAHDLVISFWPDPDRELARHFPRHPNQRFITAPALPACAPAARHYLQAVAPDRAADTTMLCPLREHRPCPGRIAIHPGSGSSAKNWPAENWGQLIAWLRRQGLDDIHLIRGEAEPRDLLAGVADAWDQLPLPRLADKLATCTWFLGHDSGISHLAAACGCAGLLLFGHTDPAVWAPPTGRLRILRTLPPMRSLSVDRVQEAVQAMLADQN